MLTKVSWHFKAFNITAKYWTLTVSHLLCFLQIWNQYFSAKDTVYAVIPVSSSPVVLHLKSQHAKLSNCDSAAFKNQSLKKNEVSVKNLLSGLSDFIAPSKGFCFQKCISLFFSLRGVSINQGPFSAHLAGIAKFILIQASSTLHVALVFIKQHLYF